MRIELTGDWKKAEDILGRTKRDIPTAIKKAVFQEAQFFVGAIKRRIGAGVPPPLAHPRGGGRDAGGRFTPGGGGTKPLNASGELRNAVTTVPEGPAFEVFIGIPRVGGKAGKRANIAEVHEFGATVVMRMTAKQRGFLFGILFPKLERNAKRAGAPIVGTRPHDSPSRGILVIKIPARPFIRPTFDEEGPKSPGRFLARLAKALGGMLGTP